MRARSLAIPLCISALALLLQSCFAPAYPTGIPCSELATCPPGQFCVEGICRLDQGPEPGDDASIPPPPDAPLPPPPDASLPPPPDAPPVMCTAPADCDDGVACTRDTCVDNRCVNAVDDTACDDGVGCTADRCDAVQGCVAEADDTACADAFACTLTRCDTARGCVVAAVDDAACNDSIDCTRDRCDPAQGCVFAPDDSVCNDGDECTTDLCTAGRGCTSEAIPACLPDCVSVLIYNDTDIDGHNLPTLAVQALGMTAIVTRDEASFAAAFDAGGFELIILDSAGLDIPPGVTSRLSTWVTGGQRLVFSHWNLNNNATLQAVLDVTTTRSLDPAPAVHAAPDSPVDFFTLLDTFPSPLVFADNAGDNGDALALASTGFVAARFGAATGPENAILVTRNNRVIVMGFLPWDIFNSDTDADTDNVNDGEELYRNELRFLCSPPAR